MFFSYTVQFGKQFVHFVFLEAHVSVVSLPLSHAGTFSYCISSMFELLLVVHYVLFSEFVLLANYFDLIRF